MKDRPFIENVNLGILCYLRIDHRGNQFLNIALGFGFAFGELV